MIRQICSSEVLGMTILVISCTKHGSDACALPHMVVCQNRDSDPKMRGFPFGLLAKPSQNGYSKKTHTRICWYRDTNAKNRLPDANFFGDKRPVKFMIRTPPPAKTRVHFYHTKNGTLSGVDQFPPIGCLD